MSHHTHPKFELIYFPIHGRAEVLRLTFALAQAEFTDVPVTDWMTLKPQMPLGQVPVLKETHGDESWMIPQSGAIIRHLGRVLHLYGQNEREHTICDYVLESAMDWRAKFMPVELDGWLPEADRARVRAAQSDYLRSLLARGL